MMLPIRHLRTTLLSVAIAVLLLGSWTIAAPPQTLTAQQATDHVGEKATVCGTVASTRYASSSRGQPTFINLDKPYPNQIFTIVIWHRNRAKFGSPEETYKGKEVCVEGTITSFRGTPEIEASSPAQIRVKKQPKAKGD